jgi:hypothetical protein
MSTENAKIKDASIVTILLFYQQRKVIILFYQRRIVRQFKNEVHKLESLAQKGLSVKV